mgnify:CR=1 FL=1
MGSLCDAARPVELAKSMGYKVITSEDKKYIYCYRLKVFPVKRIAIQKVKNDR